tara:strand:+ start:296 stop:505 length:210 start_codon:yes stop_codon:yes gene_type:complete
MNRNDFKDKIYEITLTLNSFLPKFLKAILNILSFLVYIAAMSWVLVTSLVTLAILYIGVGCSFLYERID